MWTQRQTKQPDWFFDFVNRRYFKTVKEVQSKTYDYVIIGGGFLGCATAHRLRSRFPTAQILILELGSFIVPEHLQNFSSLYNDFGAKEYDNWDAKTTGDYHDFHGLLPCVGGRSIYWSGWCPTPKPEEIKEWDKSVRQDMYNYLPEAKADLGVVNSSEAAGMGGEFHQEIRKNLAQLIKTGQLPFALPIKKKAELDGAISVDSTPHTLTNYRKFSTVPMIIDQLAPIVEGQDKLTHFVINTLVTKLETSGKEVTKIHTNNGTLDVHGAQIFLAGGTIPSTGLALSMLSPEQREQSHIGKTLQGHMRSFAFARAKLTPEEKEHTKKLDMSVIYLDSFWDDKKTGEKRWFHIHTMCALLPGRNNREDVWRQFPDIDPDTFQMVEQGEYALFALHQLAGTDHTGKIRVEDTDKGYKTILEMQLSEADKELWDYADNAIFDMFPKLAFKWKDLEYWHGKGQWKPERPPTASIRDVKLTHEGCTMPMGADPKNSPLDTNGKFYEVNNLYAAGPSVFRSGGSFNPTLAAVALAYHTVDSLPTKRQQTK